MTHSHPSVRYIHITLVLAHTARAISCTELALERAREAGANPRLVAALKRASKELELAKQCTELLADKTAHKIEKHHL